ncbi:MAG: hypothetical protein ACTSW2_03060 [Alphaproteobacteria bacterium]
MQGFLAAQGLQGLHGFFAAQGLQGLHGFFAAQGLQGLHGFFAAQGLQGLHGLHAAAICTDTSAAALAEAIGSAAAPVARVATLKATKVFFNIHASKKKLGRPGGHWVSSVRGTLLSPNPNGPETIYDEIMRSRAPDLDSRSRNSVQISVRIEETTSAETSEKSDQSLGPSAK